MENSKRVMSATMENTGHAYKEKRWGWGVGIDRVETRRVGEHVDYGETKEQRKRKYARHL